MVQEQGGLLTGLKSEAYYPSFAVEIVATAGNHDSETFYLFDIAYL